VKISTAPAFCPIRSFHLHQSLSILRIAHILFIFIPVNALIFFVMLNAILKP